MTGSFKDKYHIEEKAKDKNEFISCIVMDSQGRPMRFKRSDHLELDPGMFDNVSGHMKHGEVPLHAVIRELTEEVNFQTSEIKEIYSLGKMQINHPVMKDIMIHVYCLVTSCSEKEINEKIKELEKPELVEAIYLPSIEQLEEELQDTNGNWRINFGAKQNEMIEKLKKIAQERIEKLEIER